MNSIANWIADSIVKSIADSIDRFAVFQPQREAVMRTIRENRSVERNVGEDNGQESTQRERLAGVGRPQPVSTGR